MVRITWRSKPATSPLTGKAVRCVVVEDGNGRYWSGHRLGSKDNGSQYEFWSEPLQDKRQAISDARHSTRSFLAIHAEVYSQQFKDAQAGKEIVRVTMDDGWSVAIHAPGRLTPGERKLIALFDRLGKGRQAEPKAAAKRKGREGPSR